VSNLICTLFPNKYMQRLSSGPEGAMSRMVLGTDHSPSGFHSASAGHLPYDSFGEGIAAARVRLMRLSPALRDAVATVTSTRGSRRRLAQSPAPTERAPRLSQL
jgi:hypothetical protein